MAGASGIKAGEAFVFIEAVDKTARVFKAVGQRMQRFASKVREMGRAMLRWGIGLGTTIGIATAAIVKMSSDFQETLNKFNIVFGDSAEEIQKWGDNYAKVVGRSRQQTMDFLSDFRSILFSKGLPSAISDTMSQIAMQLAVDVGSLFNVADERAKAAIRNTLLGRPQQLATLTGVAVQVADIKDEATTLGLDPNDLSQQQLIMIRLKLAVEGLRAAWFDALNTAGFFQNMLKRVGAAAVDFGQDLGKVLLPAMTGVLEVVLEFMGKAGPFIERNFVKIGLAGILLASSLVGLGAAFIATAFAANAMGIAMGLISFASSVFTFVLSSVTAMIGTLTLTEIAATVATLAFAAAEGIAAATTWVLTAPMAALELAIGGVLIAISAVIAVIVAVTGLFQLLMAPIYALIAAFKELGIVAVATFLAIEESIRSGNIENVMKSVTVGMSILWKEFQIVAILVIAQIQDAMFSMAEGFLRMFPIIGSALAAFADTFKTDFSDALAQVVLDLLALKKELKDLETQTDVSDIQGIVEIEGKLERLQVLLEAGGTDEHSVQILQKKIDELTTERDKLFKKAQKTEGSAEGVQKKIDEAKTDRDERQAQLDNEKFIEDMERELRESKEEKEGIPGYELALKKSELATKRRLLVESQAEEQRKGQAQKAQPLIGAEKGSQEAFRRLVKANEDAKDTNKDIVDKLQKEIEQIDLILTFLGGFQPVGNAG